jgi:hypothetical protein
LGIDHYRSLAERKRKPLHVRDYTRKKTTGVTVAARRPIPP